VSRERLIAIVREIIDEDTYARGWQAAQIENTQL
jgi:hypothetical protein